MLRVITRLNVGGPAINAVLLSSRLDPARFETLLVCGTEAASEGNMLELRGIGADLDLRRVPSLGREITPFDDIRALAQLIAIARRFKPDIVHTHLAKAGTLGRLAARMSGAKAVVHTYHGTVFRGYFGRIRSRMFMSIERLLSRLTTRIIAISPSQRRELIDFGIGNEQKVIEVPLGLELEPFLAVDDVPSARARIGIRPDQPVVAIVARLVPIKNVSLFLRAMALIPSATVLVAGDGSLRPKLEAEAVQLGIDGRTRFVGWQADMRSVYAASDVVGLTSQSEGLPVSLIEAMASARAVVSTRVGGVPDLVQHDVTGVLVPPDDVRGFADAVQALLLDPRRRTALGSAARHSVYPRYDAARLVAEIAALYESLV